MPTPDESLAAFKRAWLAGERPDPHAFLAEVEEAERPALLELMDAWVLLAPTPTLSAEAAATLAAGPELAPLLAAFDAQAGPWEALVPALRERRAWSVAELAERLTARLGLDDGAARRKAAGYLDRLERGELEPAGVSRRVRDAVADLLGTTGAVLQAAVAPAPGRPAAAALFRAEGDTGVLGKELEQLADALHAPAPEGWDAIDELFCGGAE